VRVRVCVHACVLAPTCISALAVNHSPLWARSDTRPSGARLKPTYKYHGHMQSSTSFPMPIQTHHVCTKSSTSCSMPIQTHQVCTKLLARNSNQTRILGSCDALAYRQRAMSWSMTWCATIVRRTSSFVNV